MKKIYSIFITILLTFNLFGQAPQKMSYQAVIRNSSDQLVNNHAVGMRISILQGSETGTSVYIETQTPVTNTNGLISILIGSGTPVTGTFESIDWSTGTYFIKTETDPNGGTSYTITATSQLLSVPYAFFAKTAGTSNGHYIGELFGGGIVVGFWKQEGVEHGLIASLTDISIGSVWSDINVLIGLTAQNPFNGQTNTNAIIAQAGHTVSAAKLCDDYTNSSTGTGVYSDWYLPATWELNQCYISAYIVNTILGATNGFQIDESYWSSTETGTWSATCLYFKNHFFDTSDAGGEKGNSLRVRAVRRF